MSMPPDCRALKYMKQKLTDLKKEHKENEHKKISTVNGTF